jgi:hypothetical protein
MHEVKNILINFEHILQLSHKVEGKCRNIYVSVNLLTVVVYFFVIEFTYEMNGRYEERYMWYHGGKTVGIISYLSFDVIALKQGSPAICVWECK